MPRGSDFKAIMRRKRRDRQAAAERNDEVFSRIAASFGLSPIEAATAIARSMPREAQVAFALEQAYKPFESAVLTHYENGRELLDSPEFAGMLFKDWLDNRKFDYWRESIPFQAVPESAGTIIHGVSLDELQSYTLSEIFKAAFETWGEEVATMALATAFIDDPEQLRETWKIIEALAERPITQVVGGQVAYAARGPVSAAARPDLLKEGMTNIVLRLLEDPDYFDELDAYTQRSVIEFARVVQDKRQSLHDQVSGKDLPSQLVEASQILMTRDGARLVLTDEEIDRLVSIPDRVARVPGLAVPTIAGKGAAPTTGTADEGDDLAHTDFFTTDVDIEDLGEGLGLIKYREPNRTPVFTFDEEWAKDNFTKLVAVQRVLKEKYPNAQFKIGEPGALGQVFDLWNRGLDHVSAFVSTFLHQASEYFEARMLVPDRSFYARMAADLKSKIDSGVIPQEDLPKAWSQYEELVDLADDGFGLSQIVEDYKRFSSPVEFGEGFGEAITNSLHIYPGDSEYNGAKMVANLVASFALDPAIIAGKFVKGARLARILPAGATVSKSRVTQFIFDMMAIPPEAFFSGTRGREVIERLIEGGKHFDSVEEYGTHLHKIMDGASAWDREVADSIAEAAMSGENAYEATYLALLEAMTGRGATQKIVEAAQRGIDEAAGFLEYVDRVLPRRIKTLQQKRRRLVARMDAQINKGVVVHPPDADGVVEIEGWHGRIARDLPVSLSPEDAKNAPLFHFGTHRAARDRLSHLLMTTDLDGKWSLKVTRPNGKVYYTGSFKTKAEALSSIGPTQTNLNVGSLPTGGYKVEVALNPARIRPLRIRGKFFGLDDERLVLDDQDQVLFDNDFFPDLLSGKLDPSKDLSNVGRSIFDEAVAAGKTPRELLIEKGYDGFAYRNAFEDTGSISLGVWNTRWMEAADDAVRILDDEISQAKKVLAELLPERESYVAQKLFLEDVVKGDSVREFVRPVREYLTRSKLRKIAPNTARTPWGKAWDLATDLERLLPAQAYRRLGIAKLERVFKDKVLNNKANRLMQILRRMGEDTGLGARLHFIRSQLPDGSLGDEIVDQTYRSIRNFGRFIGTPESVIDEVLTALAAAARRESITDVYYAWTQGWERMVKTATRLSPEGKLQLRKMWDSFADERASEYLKEGAGTSTHATPTVSVPIRNEAGDINIVGVPVLEADMLKGFRLPTYSQIQDYVSFLRSVGRDIQESGPKILRYATNALFSLNYVWRSFNHAWATSVLAARLTGALPLRIQLEQMIRIEAFGFSSLVRHPIEWFKSVRSLKEFELISEFPAAALGIMDLDNWRSGFAKMARRGRQVVDLSDPANYHDYFTALANRYKAYYASPSSRIFLDQKLTPEEGLAKLQSNPYYWNTFKPLWDDVIAKNAAEGTQLTYLDIFKRIRKSMLQHIGKGHKEEILSFIKTGRMGVDEDVVLRSVSRRAFRRHFQAKVRNGKYYTDDVQLIGEQLLKWFEAKTFKPEALQIARRANDYIPMGETLKRGSLSDVTDFLFATFYAKPDLLVGRLPLARQIASREFRRLRKLGWSIGGATQAARVYAARQTADMLFTIGVNTSADHFLRAIMPFFPAWKELSITWLAKIPARLGGGGAYGWLFGMPTLVRRTQAMLDLLVESGLVYHDGTSWRIKFGWLKPVVKLLTGREMDSVTISAESLFSLLPAPSFEPGEPFWKGMLPSLGAPAGAIIHQFADRWNGVFEDIENNFTLFGGDQSLGPAGIDYILNAYGVTAPWQLGQSAEMAYLRQESAFIDALRIEYRRRYDTQPKREDYESDKEFVKAKVEWTEDLYEAAERQTHGWYLFRGIASSFLPFSVKYKDDAAEELSAIYRWLSSVDEDIEASGLHSAMIDGIRAAHPELGLYLVGKTLKLVPDDPLDDDKTYEEFSEEVLHGERVRFTPKEWLVWALGQQELALHRSIMNDVFEKYGSTPQSWLLSGYENSRARQEEELRWQKTLYQFEYMADLMDLRDAQGKPTSFPKMLEQFWDARKKRYAESDRYSRTIEQEIANDILDSLEALASYFDKTQMTDSSYETIRRTLNEILDEQFVSKDPIFQATARYWKVVRPYFDRKDELWNKINDPNTLPSRRAELHSELRRLENEWLHKEITDPKYGKMPPIQAVMWSKLSPKEQRLKTIDWALLPPEWLSEFQRKIVYGRERDSKKLNQLVDVIVQNQQNFDYIVGVNAISPGSKEYEELKSIMEAENAKAAKELGVEAEYRKWQRLPFERVSGLVKDWRWNVITDKIREANRVITASDYSLRGSSDLAIWYQREIVRMAEEARAQSPALDEFFRLVEIAYGEGPDKPADRFAAYWQLFFDGNPASVPGYLEFYSVNR